MYPVVTANLQKMSTQKQEKQLNLIKRIKSLADAGLVYSENKYDEERYTELREISLELLSDISSQEIESLRSFIKPEKDYPTPKVDIRAFALNELKQILLVKESYDGKWALPGGWGDIGYTPSEVAIKEIKEETGLTASPERILAIYDKRNHPHPPQPFYVYKIVFLCKLENYKTAKGFDIEDVAFFEIDNLPELSEDRILKSQIQQLYSKVINGEKSVYYD